MNGQSGGRPEQPQGREAYGVTAQAGGVRGCAARQLRALGGLSQIYTSTYGDDAEEEQRRTDEARRLRVTLHSQVKGAIPRPTDPWDARHAGHSDRRRYLYLQCPAGWIARPIRYSPYSRL